MRPSSIIYINFSQYDNTGRILNYLTETFTTVFHFSFDHLRLKHGRKTNVFTIYESGKKTKTVRLYSLRVPSILLFPSLPLVAILMIAQTFLYTYRYSRSLRDTPIFFTVNAYPALIGILLKKLGLVSQVYYWVWDYFPLQYPDWRMRLIRYAYLYVDMFAIHYADRLIFPNRRQLKTRNALRPIRNHITIIPLGSSKPIRYHTRTSRILGFMGMLKDSQGLSLLINNLPQLFTDNPDITIEIIGSGPEEKTYREMSEQYKNRIKFYGFIEDQNRINKIVRRWFAGLAVYEPVVSNESYYGDPSKIKVYLSQGVAIITTRVTEYGILVKKHSFGKVIPYKSQSLIHAIQVLYRHQHTFKKHALSFAHKFYYKELYKGLFR